MFYKTRQVRIAGTGSYVPETVVSNAELAERVATTAEWIESNLGIRERRIAASDEFTSDLAARAGLSAMANAGIGRADVDLVIVATATPDRRAPSAACIAQEKMGITTMCPSFDISAVCSGFLYAMTVGSQFIQTGMYKNVLVIGADTFSRITDWNRRDCVFFGDGAGAVVLQESHSDEGLFSSVLYADGRGRDGFTVFPGDRTFTMNAKAVFDTGATVLTAAIKEVVEKNGFTMQDVSAIIPHQPSIKLLRKTAELLDFPFERVQRNMDRYANTSGGTVPLLLDEVHRSGRVKAGDLVVFAAVGSGWAWGASIYRWL
jgi:3-oxoacyl-[acyl-carrier-protein] synthase III